MHHLQLSFSEAHDVLKLRETPSTSWLSHPRMREAPWVRRRELCMHTSSSPHPPWVTSKISPLCCPLTSRKTHSALHRLHGDTTYTRFPLPPPLFTSNHQPKVVKQELVSRVTPACQVNKATWLDLFKKKPQCFILYLVWVSVYCCLKRPYKMKTIYKIMLNQYTEISARLCY